MRTAIRVVLGLVLLVVVVAVAGIGFLLVAYPKVSPAPSLQVERTPERIARGDYLANHVLGCTGCHAQRDWTKFAGPPKTETLGQGGERLDPETSGIPNSIFYTPNITPAAIGSWSDGELKRAITTGIRKDGTAIFPMMGYRDYGQMADEDIDAVIAYVRTLPSHERTWPKGSFGFPLNFVARTFPGPSNPQPKPAASDRAAYGKYLVSAVGCVDCHTKTDNLGRQSPDRFAGGQEFLYPPKGYRVVSANITPDADTGIGSWTEQQFIDKFKGFETPAPGALTDADARQNTIMPWTVLAGMTREDLGAVYAYLRTLKPIVNRVNKHPDALPVTQ